jgi:tRNA(fMet)-specific endonuclease VapC
MTGDVLLDTNIVIAFFAGDSTVLAHLQQSTFFVPSIVLGELYTGARKSSRATENLARIDAMIPSHIVLSCDVVTAQFYGIVKHTLLAKGRPIPENDIWIAAIAEQYDLKLISRDTHFNEVDGLVVETW